MGWRHDTRKVIRAYPALKRAESELKRQKVIPSYSGMPKPSGASRSTEETATRELPKGQQRELDAVRYSIETTNRYRNGDLRIKMIDLVYWRNTHTLTGAAMALHVSIDTARHWHSDFVELVDAYLRIL